MPKPRARLDGANQSSLQVARALEDWVGAFCIAQARAGVSAASPRRRQRRAASTAAPAPR
jgi:hypothetical protein